MSAELATLLLENARLRQLLEDNGIDPEPQLNPIPPTSFDTPTLYQWMMRKFYPTQCTWRMRE